MPTEKTETKDPSPPRPGGNLAGGGAPRGKSGWTSRFRRKGEDTQHEKKKQLQDYTAWVNNYLKRRPGISPVTDLRSNLQDGITLINLIEIVAHVQLEGVDRQPASLSSRRCNVDRAIDFLRGEGVILQGDPAKDILDGNSKGIMRVILGIAERYQPRSVKQRTENSKPTTPTGKKEPDVPRDHMTFLLQTDRNSMLKRSVSPDGMSRGGLSSFPSNSCSVPNMASLNVHAGGGAGDRMSTPRSGGGHRYITPTHSNPLTNVTVRSPGCAPPNSTGHRGLSQPDRPFHFQDRGFVTPQVDMSNDTYATPADTLPPDMGTRIIQPKKKTGVSSQVRHRPVPLNMRSHPEESRVRAMSSPVSGAPPQAVVDPGVYREMDLVLSGLVEFKDELLQLHSLLFKNSDGSLVDPDLVVTSDPTTTRDVSPNEEQVEEEQGPVADDSTSSTPTPQDPAMEALSTINILAVQDGEKVIAEKTREIKSLQEKLSQFQDEFMQMEAECVTLRQMLEEKNAFITTMKSEVYRKEYRNDTQRVDLQSQILQKEAVIKKLEGELTSVRENIKKKEEEYEEVSSQLEKKEKVESDLQKDVDSLKTEVKRLTEVEETLLGRIASRERKISHLEDKMAEVQDSRSKRVDSVSEDADGIREKLGQLRGSVSPQDHQQQIIDELERSISEMMGRLMERSGSPSGKRSRRHRDGDDYHRERDRERDRRKRHKEKHSLHIPSSGTEPKGGEAVTPTTPTGGGMASDISTKVLYYMHNEKAETPYVMTIPKKPNEITLGDFKSVFDRQGTFRFYFKTEDPDIGVVKEQITADDQILPNWKGKILVWVSEIRGK